MSSEPRTPGFLRFYRDHLEGPLHWGATHFLVIVIIVFAVRLLYMLIKHRRGIVRRRGLRKTAPARNLATKIGPKIGWKNAERFITWPRDVQAVGAPIVIRYPETFTALDRETAFISEIISSLVGGTWDPDHDHRHHRLKFVRRAEPRELPSRVNYVDDPTMPVDVIPFAKDDQDEWVTAKLTTLTHHVLVSATTGWGKTSTLSLFVAHVAARGGLIDICDPKMIGYAHFEGLPMIRISTEIEEMIDTIERFRDEMEEAYRQIKAGRAPTNAPMRMLVIDELGSFADMCIDHHHASGGRGQTPPIFRTIKRILWMGRAAGFHVISATQQANIKALFGASDPRDQYAMRIAAGPQSAEAWSMLFGSAPRPQIDPIKGRAVIGISAEFKIAQLARISPTQARQVAARGQGRHVVNVVDMVKKPADSPEAETPEPTITTLHLVPPIRSSPARADAQVRRGRPTNREPVELECAHCQRVWSTGAADGSSVKCPGCGKSRRVPARARS